MMSHQGTKDTKECADRKSDSLGVLGALVVQTPSSFGGATSVL
jgi:hypothetical protein